MGNPAVSIQRTWNSEEQIARHREMTVEERIKRTIELSRAALKLASAERVQRRGG